MELSTLSLILSIIGLFFVPCSIAGIVVGKKSLQQEGYSKEARAAIVIGWVGIGLWIVSCCIFLLISVAMPLVFSQDSSYSPPIEEPLPQPTEVIIPTPDHSQWQLGVVCEDDGGARVVSVLPSSPADRMGIQEGDVIVNVNGTMIVDCSHLREVVSLLERGESLKIGVLRGPLGEKEITYLSTTVQ